MTEVPIESVGLKLFFRPRQISDHGDSRLLLAGTFLDPLRRRAKMIAFYDLLVRICPRARPCRCRACAMFAAISARSARRGCDRSIRMPSRVDYGYPAPLRRRRDRALWRAPPSGAAFDSSWAYGRLPHTSIGALFMARHRTGIVLALMLAAVTFFVALRNGYPRDAEGAIATIHHRLPASSVGLLRIGIVLWRLYAASSTPTRSSRSRRV